MPALYANLPRKRPKTARKHRWKHQTAVDWWDPLSDFQDPVLRGLLGNWELTYQTFGNDISNQPLEKENHLQIAFSGAMSAPGKVQFIKYKRTWSFNLAAFSDPSCPILTHSTWLFFQNSWSKFGAAWCRMTLEICCDNHAFFNKIETQSEGNNIISDFSILQFSTISPWNYQQIGCAFLSSKSHRAWNPGCQVRQLTWVWDGFIDTELAILLWH